MKRNKFSLSHYKLFTCDMGELVPIGLVEVLPGDTLQQATSLLLRTQPLLAPVMHPTHVRIHHWFVPHRIVWNDWESFITGGADGIDQHAVPTKTVSAVASGSLADYLGVPVGFSGEVSALPFRGYTLIWNEHYRDQDLQPLLPFTTVSGNDTTTNAQLQNVCWEKDYFTSSRPWPQKGPAVTIPIGNTAPVIGYGIPATSSATASGAISYGSVASADLQSGTPSVPIGDTFNTAMRVATSSTGAVNATTNRPQLFADLSTASAVTITALREAMALQRYEEARARYGSRYVEYLRYLGVRSSDARLQRPEYLGGGRQTIQFSEVLQSAPTTTPAGNVGDLKGHGIAAMRSNRYRRFFEEHGYVYTFVSCLPRTMYMQGLKRTWNRRNKDDFWQKEFQHIGQQEVLNKELYAAHATPDGVFGYQDRYDEYRRQESSVSGDFRGSLDFWHFARSFATAPALNASFVSAVPTERVFPAPSADVLWVMGRHSIQARRMISRQGTSFTF